MRVSTIVITRNELPRLKLALSALATQSLPTEVIVVNDGSTDGTREYLDQLAKTSPLKVVHRASNHGISPSRNEGAALATGEVLLFLDGDVLCCPKLVELHARVHAGGGQLLGRGEQLHLRCTRFFLDPETAEPYPDSAERVKAMGPEREASRVTRQQVMERFEEIERRAEPGLYQGLGPKRLYELELELLTQVPDSAVSWMAASGHNLSLRREVFEAVGGYDATLIEVEQRELALRVCERGGRVVPVLGARSYHLLHKSRGRDPLQSARTWEPVLLARHPSAAATKLMLVFWQSLAKDKDIPEPMRITSLRQFDQLVRAGREGEYRAVRAAHPVLGELDRLPGNAWPG